MADITKCNLHECPKSNCCWRHEAPDGEYQQSYFGFHDEESKKLFMENCMHFWKMKGGIE